MCAYCEQWLVFTDVLSLRIATDAEIESVHPELRRLIVESREYRRKVH